MLILQSAVSLLVNLIAAGIGYALRIVVENRSRLRLLCESKLKRNEQVRVSAAYLFRIKVDERFLLIKGNKIRSQYQPVGGVYKRFASSDAVMNGLGVIPDSSLKTDADDLRVRMPGKSLLGFVDWFDSREGREIDLRREFCEELGPLGVLSDEDVSSFSPEFIRQCERKLSYSKHFDVRELLLHDVYEIRLSEESKNRVRDYVRNHPGGELVLAESGDIGRETCYVDGSNYAIAATAKEVM